MIVLVAGGTMVVPFGEALDPPLDELPDELELPPEDEPAPLDEDEPPPDEAPDELDELLLLLLLLLVLPLLEVLPPDELLPDEDDEELLLLGKPELDDPAELLEIPSPPHAAITIAIAIIGQHRRVRRTGGLPLQDFLLSLLQMPKALLYVADLSAEATPSAPRHNEFAFTSRYS